jgi:peptidoglycan/LPS O-acetylase OafA/YrhL
MGEVGGQANRTPERRRREGRPVAKKQAVRGGNLKRLYSLDALRGLAALSVVFWHWQHFFALSGSWQDGWQRDSQPFFWAFKLLYEAGWAAVDLFFALSGFVFFWLYSAAIAGRSMPGAKFSLLRFSRLYPLYFATLALTALLQFWFLRRTGQYFIFDSGDWQRFAAGLAMAQQWLPPTEEQFFDGPAWSVSIEVLLYVLFFCFCRWGLARPRNMLVAAGLGLLLLFKNEFIARGLMGFFLGGAVWRATEWVKRRGDALRIARMLAVLALAGWGLAIAEDYTGVAHGLAYWTAGHISPAAGRFYIGESDNLFLLPFIFILSPLTIAALALNEQLRGWRFQKLAFFGDISYSTYLLHFPLQLICVLAALRFGWTPLAFMNPVVMLGFFAALIGVGAASHYGFERPMQRVIRGLAGARSPAPAEA